MPRTVIVERNRINWFHPLLVAQSAKRRALVFICGRTVDSWYGGLVQAEIHRELSAVVCHVAKERFVQGHVPRCVEQNPAFHHEAPGPLEALVGCSLKGLARFNEPIVKRL